MGLRPHLFLARKTNICLAKIIGDLITSVNLIEISDSFEHILCVKAEG